MASWRWSENRGDNDDDNGDSRSPAGEQEGEELEKGEEGEEEDLGPPLGLIWIQHAGPCLPHIKIFWFHRRG